MISKIINIGKIVTWDNVLDDLSVCNQSNLEIMIQDNEIIEIGENLENNKDQNIIDAENGLITPGFVDCHTHPIFFGDRSHEFKLRSEGKTYQDIAKTGGGIKYSIKKFREATKEQIFEEALPRIKSFLKKGTTTIEAKSGYGLTLNDEIKSLEVIKMLNDNSNLDIIPTFMGAHDFPMEYHENKNAYVDLICNEMIPRVAEYKLAKFCDVFCEIGYFSVKQSERILKTGMDYGLLPRLHADEFADSGAAQLAADIKACSADHLMHSNKDALKAMADNNVVSVILPGTTFFLGKKEYVNAENIINSGGEIAIASDYNPGSCTIQSMPMIMFLSNLYCKLPLEQSFKATTYNPAKALKLDQNIGLVKKGYIADLLIWNIKELSEIPYMFNNEDRFVKVIKNGNVIN